MSEAFLTALPQPENVPAVVRGSGLIRTIRASDGYLLHFRHWKAENRRGVVVALHGIQSHSGWYEYSAWRLCRAGYDVYFADRRGSGLNSIDRGHADHGLRLINDTRQLISLVRVETFRGSGGLADTGVVDEDVRSVSTANVSLADATGSMSAAGQAPLTLLGLSWGGKIAAALAALFPEEIDHLALLYPGLEPQLRPTGIQRVQLKAARDFDVRRKPVRIPLADVSLFTDSDFWQKAISNDRLALHIVTSGFINSGIDLERSLNTHKDCIMHPVLLMQAGRDRIIDNVRTRTAVARFGSSRVEMIAYDKACHTLEFDVDRDRFIDDLTDWLNRRSAAFSRSADQVKVG